jgi:2-amino-4-hydroxy-6-hydroxymethyldihydropteridine diphosphokinase
MVPVAVALGSNLGDREQLLHDAVAALGEVLDDLRVSTWHRTAPVGVGSQPEFLNGAAIGRTSLPARELLRRLLDIERQFGRERPFPGAARTLDLDVILYGDQVISEPDLTVPHPRFRERRFVLAPLAEIASEWVDPGTGMTVGELLKRVDELTQDGGGNDTPRRST